MPSLKKSSASNLRSQITRRISEPVSRLGQFSRILKSKPRIEGPFPYIPRFQDEQFAGIGSFGVCRRFYSDQYDSDQKARSFIKKEIINPGEQGSENPEILAKVAQLNHPNIVQYVRFGKEGSPIIMRDAGKKLDDLKWEKHQWQFYEDLTIYLQILTGAQALHNSEIHHRDLSDKNITIQKDGTVKIIDFGWAVVSTSFDIDEIITSADEECAECDLKSDISRLRKKLDTILAKHEKITTSDNIKEKEHYKILSDFAQSGHFDLSDLISKLETMRDCFPKWGNEPIPSTTDFESVHELQEHFRAKPSSTGWKRWIAQLGIVKKARQFFH